MVTYNYAKKEIHAKIVYYGPGLSGKTTNVEIIHKSLQEENRGKLISIETKTDRTLFFDFLPIVMGKLHDFTMRYHIYTVPGQVFYNETRKAVLRGADGMVFVADSQTVKLDENKASLSNLEENLRGQGKNLKTLPMVIQYNKRDLPDIMSVDELNRHLNPRSIPSFEAVAIQGEGVLATLTRITRLVNESIAPAGTEDEKETKTPAPIEEVEILEEVPAKEKPQEKMPGIEKRPEIRFDEPDDGSDMEDFGEISFDGEPESVEEVPTLEVSPGIQPEIPLEPAAQGDLETIADTTPDREPLRSHSGPEREIIECGSPVKIAKGTVRVPLILKVGEGISRISLTISIEEDPDNPA